EAPPAKPRNPSKTRAGEIGRNSAVISWEHKAGSNATTYSVWIRDVAATCTVSAPFNGRQSCRLDGLNPGTSYTANVYAENAIGRRSVRTDRVKFTTAAPPPPPPPPPPPVDKERPDEATTTTTSTTTTIKTVVIRDLDPECVGRGGHVRKHEKATKRANRKFNKGIDKVTKKFESRPAKLAKKIKRITKRRDRRIARANTEFDVSCPAPTS
ncbi:MAG: fibronectin type III domain-containing protein, partial [Acidimicrobiales bacterium]